MNYLSILGVTSTAMLQKEQQSLDSVLQIFIFFMPKEEKFKCKNMRKIYKEILLQYVKFVQNESLYKLHFAKTKIVFKEWAHPTVIMRYLVRINLNLLTSGIGQNCLIKI